MKPIQRRSQFTLTIGAWNRYINFSNARVIMNNFLDDLNFGVLVTQAYCQSHFSYHGKNVGKFLEGNWRLPQRRHMSTIRQYVTFVACVCVDA